MTLVEVLVATVLLGVGVAGLLFSAAAGMRNQQRTGQRMAALCLAQEKLAEIDAVGPRVWSLTQSSRGVTPREGATYEWSVAVESMSEGELYDVQVEVSWSGAGGAGAVKLETLLNDYEAVATLGPEMGGPEQPTEGMSPPAGEARARRVRSTHRPHPGGPWRGHGFTLVEMLVALTVGSLLVIAAVSATQALSTSRETVERHVEREAAARRAMETIVAALRNVRRDPTREEPVVVGESGAGGEGSDKIAGQQ